jgi:hypothetical protein
VVAFLWASRGSSDVLGLQRRSQRNKASMRLR